MHEIRNNKESAAPSDVERSVSDIFVPDESHSTAHQRGQEETMSSALLAINPSRFQGAAQ